MENNICPPVEELLSWVDGERKDLNLETHIDHCSNCRNRINDFQRESEEMWQFFDQIPLMPDISSHIMDRLHNEDDPYSEIRSLFSYLFVTSLSFTLVVFHYFFTGWFREGFWPVTLAKFLYLTSNLSHFAYSGMKHLLTRAAVGEPLLPAITVAIAAILINILYKGRISNA